jgi:hypothetical protein
MYRCRTSRHLSGTFCSPGNTFRGYVSSKQGATAEPLQPKGLQLYRSQHDRLEWEPMRLSALGYPTRRGLRFYRFQAEPKWRAEVRFDPDRAYPHVALRTIRAA